MAAPVHPLIDTAFLDFLAGSLASAVADNGTGALVHVDAGARADGPDIGVLPLEGQHPTEMLVGTVAPDHWSVLGVATTGRASSLDGSGGRAGPVVVVVLVTRDGRVVGRVEHDGKVFTDPPASGLILDCLQRAFGLPTAPPDVTPAHLIAILLLERALAGEPPGLGDALLAAFDETGPSLGWARIRQLIAGVGWPQMGLSPDDVAWFDEGSFARWVLAQYRPVPALLAEARRTLGPAGARRCGRVLRRLGVAAT